MKPNVSSKADAAGYNTGTGACPERSEE